MAISIDSIWKHTLNRGSRRSEEKLALLIGYCRLPDYPKESRLFTFEWKMYLAVYESRTVVCLVRAFAVIWAVVGSFPFCSVFEDPHSLGVLLNEGLVVIGLLKGKRPTMNRAPHFVHTAQRSSEESSSRSLSFGSEYYR